MLRRLLMAGGSPPPSGSTFDPSLKGSNVVLSNGDMDATKTGAGYQSVYTTQGRSSGRYAFEMLVTARPSASSIILGIADKTTPASVITTFLGNNSGVVETLGYNNDSGGGLSRLYRRMTVGNTNGTTAPQSYGVGDIVTVDVDFSTNLCRLYKNGTITGYGTIAITSGKTYFPAASLQADAAVRFIPTGLTYLPAGATAWG